MAGCGKSHDRASFYGRSANEMMRRFRGFGVSVNRAMCVFWLASRALGYEASYATLTINLACNTQFRFAAR